MLIAIISAVVMLALFDRAVRGDRVATAQDEFRFTILKIRDELRREARRGVIAEDRWFSYMDTTLTRTASAVFVINIWHAMAFMFACNMRKVEEADQARRKALKVRPGLARIYDQYGRAVLLFIRERHALLWKVLDVIARSFGALRATRERVLEAVKGDPQVSTLLTYADATP